MLLHELLQEIRELRIQIGSNRNEREPFGEIEFREISTKTHWILHMDEFIVTYEISQELLSVS